MAKNGVIMLAFGGGLIPAAVAANKSMMATITGRKAEKDIEEAEDYQGSLSRKEEVREDGGGAKL